MEEIVNIQLGKLGEKLLARGIRISIKPEVKSYLVSNGFDADYGARPVKRLIQKAIVDALADIVVKGGIKNGKRITVALNKSNRVEVTV